MGLRRYAVLGISTLGGLRGIGFRMRWISGFLRRTAVTPRIDDLRRKVWRGQELTEAGMLDLAARGLGDGALLG